MLQRAGHSDAISRQDEVQVVGAQRIETRIGSSIGDGRRAVDRQRLAPEEPAPGSVAKLQRDLADGASRAAEIAVEVAGDAAAEPRRIEDDRRRLSAESGGDGIEAESLVNELSTSSLDVQRRAADPAVQHRRREASSGHYPTTGPLGDDCALNGTYRQTRGSELDGTHLQRVEADQDA